MGQKCMQILLWMTLIGSMTGFVTILFRFLCKKLPKKWMVYLWLIVFFRLLCPVSIITPFSAFRLFEISKETLSVPEAETTASLPGNEELSASPQKTMNSADALTAAENAAAAIEDTSLSKADSPAEYGHTETEDLTIYQEIKNESPEIHTQSEKPPAAALSAAAWFLQNADIFWLIWVFGSGIFAAISLFQFILLRRKLSGAIKISDGVYITDQISGAFLIGFFRPRIYLPAGFTGEFRTMMLIHERMHARYGDHFLKQLAFLCVLIHWFNPLVWFFFWQFGNDLELACDERVMLGMSGKDRVSYAKVLAAAMEGRSGAAYTLPFRSGNAVSRIRGIVSYRKPSWTAMIAAAAALILFTSALATNSTAMPMGNTLTWEADTEDQGREELKGQDFRAELFTKDGRLKKAEQKPLLSIPDDIDHYLKGYASYDASGVTASMLVKNTLGYLEPKLSCSVDCYCYNGVGSIVGMCHASNRRMDWSRVECSAEGICYAAPAYAEARFTFGKKTWVKMF